jgi:hypothetical protein
MSSSYSRREFVVKGALGTVAVGGGLTGVAYARQGARARPRSVRPPQLWNAATLQEWQERMVGLGPLGRMGGYPALDKWTDMVQEQLEITGLSVIRDPQTMGSSQQSWTPTKWSLTVTNDHGYGPTEIPVASFYPYSGTTPPGGITAPLLDAGTGLDFSGQDFTGAIALVQIPYLNSEYETYGDLFAGNTVFNPGTRYLTYAPGTPSIRTGSTGVL